MIGPILVAVSWVLLRIEGRGLDALGFDRASRRLIEFAIGFVTLGAIAALQQLGLAAATGDAFVVNPGVSSRGLLDGLRFTVNSVLYEELVFRGYLLYRAVRWIGPRRAALLDAAAFGVYHWFSYGALGNPVVMVYVFVLTGAFGLMCARAFVATGSVGAPIGLHLGWNAVSYLVFSAGPFGPALLVPASGAARINAGGWASLVFNLLLPLAATLAVAWCFRPKATDCSPREREV